jgi:hypothetical protein
MRISFAGGCFHPRAHGADAGSRAAVSCGRATITTIKTT